MELKHVNATVKTPVTAFTGDVYLTPINSGTGPPRMTVALVRFTPGARTNSHSHAVGQILHVTDGVALVGTRDGTVVRARAGDTVVCPPGEDHWHGRRRGHFHESLDHARGRARRRRPHHLARAGHRPAVQDRQPGLTGGIRPRVRG